MVSNFKALQIVTFLFPYLQCDTICFSARPSWVPRLPSQRKFDYWKVGGWIPTQQPYRLIQLLWLGSFHILRQMGQLAASVKHTEAHSTRLTSGVGALWKNICVSMHVVQSLATCDHFLKTISVLGHQILLSSRKKTDSLVRRYVLQQQLFSLQRVLGSVRSALKRLSFVKRMFPGEKQCLGTKTRIILTP